MSYGQALQNILDKDPFIKLWEDNYNSNLLSGEFSLERAKPIVFLTNTMPYKNPPVVLIAAGPSIDKNINELKNYQDKAIIFCADINLFSAIDNNIKFT